MPGFEESLPGVQIKLCGSVAVAPAVCEQKEQDAPPDRAVEALLLVKENGRWRIAAQGWDKERDEDPVPEAMLD